MSEPICKIRVIAYQKHGEPIMEGEDPEVFEFCCWDSCYQWLSKFSLHKCKSCRKNSEENKIITLKRNGGII